MQKLVRLCWLYAGLALVLTGCFDDPEDEVPADPGDASVAPGDDCTGDETRACIVSDGCVGSQACVDGTFGACSAPAEMCDSVDNDCDGTIDEGFDDLGQDCEEGDGACADSGTVVCAPDGMSTVCNAQPGDMTDEVCDGVDNDCDGIADEEVAVDEACETGLLGQCGSGTTSCADGAVVCTPAAEPAEETCDGIDNDCDGRTDEDENGGPLAQPCYEGPDGTEGNGPCVGGVALCVDGEFGGCMGQVLPGEEICDAVDNNCDAEIDNVEGQACACAPGTVQACYTGPEGTDGVGACAAGTQACAEDGSGYGPCESEIVPSLELCDGIDNDCDGEVDNAAGAGEACSVGEGACGSDGVRVCDPATGQVVCDAEAGLPADEVCNGVDDDCDGMIDDVEGAGEICELGQGVCLARGILRCGPGGELACDAEEIPPQPELCNGLDDDCNGEVDDLPGLGEACEVGVGACRSAGVQVCTPEGVACGAVPLAPGREACGNRVDDDCDGETDEEECIIPCELDEQCGRAELCVDGACVPGDCREDVNCLEGELCIDSFCRPGNCREDGDCIEGEVCDGNFCAQVPEGCAEPPVIDAFGQVEGSTAESAPDFGASCGGQAGSPDEGYILDLGDFAGTICVDTVGSDYDTVLHVRGDCARAATELACNDDLGGGNLRSRLQWDIEAGSTHFVIVDGFGANNSGNYILRVREGACDACEVDPDCADTEVCAEGQCVPRTCGDGVRTFGEQCDDGGRESGDGCSNSCEVEEGFSCFPAPPGARAEVIVDGQLNCPSPEQAAPVEVAPWPAYRMFYRSGGVQYAPDGRHSGAISVAINGELAGITFGGAFPSPEAVEEAVAGNSSDLFEVPLEAAVGAFFADEACDDNRNALTGELLGVDYCRPDACEADDDCIAGREICADGLCQEGECAADEDCGPEALCLDLRCEPGNCREDADCLEGEQCTRNFCRPPEVCDDNVGNDGDDATDCLDDDCAEHPSCQFERAPVGNPEPPPPTPIAPPGHLIGAEGELDDEDPQWARPLANCAPQDPADHYFEVFPVVNETGAPQQLTVTATWEGDGYLHAFRDPFAPDALEGCIDGDDDFNGLGQSQITDLPIAPGELIWVIASTFTGGAAIGPYSIDVLTEPDELCADGLDNDDDTLVDCDDPDCATDFVNCPECAVDEECPEPGSICVAGECVASPEDCVNGEDDNENGLIDCDDPTCVDDIACLVEDCGNDVDDDLDEAIDCDDPDCAEDFVNCPECGVDPDCNEGELCVEGECVLGNCREDGECAEGELCEANNCRPGVCREDIDCNEGEVCDDFNCVPTPAECLDPGPRPLGFEVVLGSTAEEANDFGASCAGGAGGAGSPDIAFELLLDGYTGTVCANTFGSGYDTSLYLRGECGTRDSEIACNDDASGLQSQLEFEVEANASYFLFLDGFSDGSSGDFRLSVRPGACDVGCNEDLDCGNNQLCDEGVCIPAGCGDGNRSFDEGCDDGNREDGDGCNRGCEVEEGWGCVEAPQAVNRIVTVDGLANCAGPEQGVLFENTPPWPNYRAFYSSGAVGFSGDAPRFTGAYGIGINGAEAFRVGSEGDALEEFETADEVAEGFARRATPIFPVQEGDAVNAYFWDLGCDDNAGTIDVALRTVSFCRLDACEDDGQCAPTELCIDGGCVRADCRDDAECGEGEICSDNLCGPGCRDDATCGEGEICLDDLCVPGCRGDEGCAEGQLCVESACIEGNCRLDEECDPGLVCVQNNCRLDPEICDDGIGNDGDNATDCLDDECADHPSCQVDPRVEPANDPPLPIGAPGHIVGFAGSLDAEDGRWARPAQGAGCAPSVGNDHPFEFFTIINDSEAPQRIRVDAAWNGDGYLHIFREFDPADPNGEANECIIGDDDFNGTRFSQIATVDIAPGEVLTIVASTFSANANIGAYTVDVLTFADEVCDDGLDNDDDTLADCLDPDCGDAPNCAACEGDEECAEGRLCIEGVCIVANCRGDEECEPGQICEENSCRPGCRGDEGCPEGQICEPDICVPGCRGDEDCPLGEFCSPEAQCAPLVEVCDNGEDDDEDELVDCDDPDCRDNDPICAEPEICDDGVDNDQDGATDCADIEDCGALPECSPFEVLCEDAADNDGDELADCLDPDCALEAAGLCEVPFCAEQFEAAGEIPELLATDGDAPWLVIEENPFDGAAAAVSGDITHNQQSSLSWNVSVPEGGQIAFRYRVSSESNFDFLRLLIDDVEVEQWSGDVPWTERVIDLEPGDHTIVWRYTKDGSVDRDEDRAQVDRIILTGSACPGPPDPPGPLAFTTGEVLDLMGGEGSCAFCHTNGGRSGGLNFDDFIVDTVGVPSLDLPAMSQIEPFDRQQSYLWHKLNNSHIAVGGAGGRMPRGGAWIAEDIERFGLWIDQGAGAQDM